MLKQTFKKKERLHSKKKINFLFENGKSFFIYPFKVIYTIYPEKNDVPAEILISVSKKKLKTAVKRNKIKRIVREAYRKNKYIIHKEPNKESKSLLIAFIYVSDEVLNYETIERKIILILQRLNEQDEKIDR